MPDHFLGIPYRVCLVKPKAHLLVLLLLLPTRFCFMLESKPETPSVSLFCRRKPPQPPFVSVFLLPFKPEQPSFGVSFSQTQQPEDHHEPSPSFCFGTTVNHLHANQPFTSPLLPIEYPRSYVWECACALPSHRCIQASMVPVCVIPTGRLCVFSNETRGGETRKRKKRQKTRTRGTSQPQPPDHHQFRLVFFKTRRSHLHGCPLLYPHFSSNKPPPFPTFVPPNCRATSRRQHHLTFVCLLFARRATKRSPPLPLSSSLLGETNEKQPSNLLLVLTR